MIEIIGYSFGVIINVGVLYLFKRIICDEYIRNESVNDMQDVLDDGSWVIIDKAQAIKYRADM